MAANIFFKLAGVEGEATQKSYEKQLELLGFSFRGSNHSHTAGGGMAKGKPTTDPVTFTKYVDKSSIAMTQKMLQGEHFKDALISVLKSGDKGQWCYMTYAFDQVMINDVSVSADSTGALHETVTFSYNKVTVTYSPQKEEGGKAGDAKLVYDAKAATIA